MDINKVIGNAVDKVSLKTANGMVDLNDAYHVFMVQEELKKHIPEDIVEGLFDTQIISEAKSYSSFKNASIWEENGSDKEKAANNRKRRSRTRKRRRKRTREFASSARCERLSLKRGSVLL